MTRARDLSNLGSQAGSGLDASDITSGILPVGVVGGSGLNAVNPANLASGVMPVGVTGGSGLNAVGAGNLASGVLPATVTGGSGLNAVNAANIAAGVLPVGVTGGSGLTAVNAANIASGVLPVGVTGGSGLTALASNPTVTLGSNTTFPAGHVIQVTAMTPNRTQALSEGSLVATACAHGITVTAGNDILVTATVPYRMVAPGSAPPYMAMSFLLKHSTDNSTFANVADGVMPTTGVPQRAYIDNSDGSNVNANLYLDDTLTWNWLDESVSGTVHYYKIYFTGHQGSNYVSYDEVYSTMTLTEIQS